MKDNIDILFDTPAEKAEAVLQFENLMGHRGWQYVCKIIQLNIDYALKILKEGSAGETKETIDLIRANIKAWEDVINTPKKMIKNLTEELPQDQPLDPYHDPIDGGNLTTE